MATPTRLDAVGCPDTSIAELRRLVSIEIGQELSDDDEAERRLTVVCEADSESGKLGRIHLSAREHSTSRVLARDVAITQVPDTGVTRLIAIAVGELAAALDDPSHGAPAAAPPAAPPPALAPPAPPPPRATPRDQRSVARARPPGPLRFGAMATVRASSGTSNPLLGGGALVQITPSLPLSLSLEVNLEAASQQASLGSIHALLGSLATLASLTGDQGPVRGTLGVGARAGVARLTGTPTASQTTSELAVTGASVTGLWGGPLCAAGVSMAIGSRSFVFLEAEVGWATSSVVARAGGSDLAGLRRQWGALSLGLGLSR